MATDIVTQAVLRDEPPGLETVLVWLTVTVERDYAARDVFPELRTANAAISRATSALHLLSFERAEAVLHDAESRLQQVGKSLKVAYKSHAAKVRSEIETAKTRRAQFESSEPTCSWKTSSSEWWIGTKEQLQALGICIAGPYPGGPCGKRYATALDARGYKARITRAVSVWALYDVRIEIPEEVLEAAEQDKQRADAEQKTLDRFQRLPATAEQFKKQKAESFWGIVNMVIPKQSEGDGYAFTDAVLETFYKKITKAFWVLRNGETRGSSPREKLQRELCEHAKADAPLQAFLSGLRGG